MQRALEGIDSAGKTSDICKLLRMVQNTLLVTIRLELALSFRWLLSMGHVLYFQKLAVRKPAHTARQCSTRTQPQDQRVEHLAETFSLDLRASSVIAPNVRCGAIKQHDRPHAARMD